MDGGGIAPAPSPGPGGHIPSRASSALAAVSVVLVLLYLFWRFIWQYKKHVPRNNDGIGAANSSSSSSSSSSLAQRPSCPSRTACIAGEAAVCTRETSPLPVFVHVAGAEKAECAVCLVEFGDGEAGRIVPGCGHGFHAECIETWFRVNSTCPLCRGAAAVGAAADQRAAGGVPRM